jgi:hypothetical protein
MTIDQLLAALDLPDSSRVDRRVPKKLLMENGAAVAADKRLITDGVAELLWIAALKPTTVAIPEYRDDVREYLEIAVLFLTLNPDGKAPRLLELVHRAIPYPVVLLSLQGKTPGLSLAEKRWSQGESGKTVIDGDLTKIEWTDGRDDKHAQGFLKALPLTQQPKGSLRALYRSWVDSVVALEVARRTGAFTTAGSSEESEIRRLALEECSRLEAEIAKLRTAAGKEKQIPRRVDLNLKLKDLQAQLGNARSRL